MGKMRNNQAGFGAKKVLLGLSFIAIVIFISVYVVHNHDNTKTAALTPASTTSAPTLNLDPHTSQGAVTFVQTTYDNYIEAIKNPAPSNTKPLGLVGLAGVEPNLTPDFYAQAAASQNGSLFSCAAQFLPSGYTASLASSSGTTATVAVTILNSADGSTTTTGMTVSVDIASLKITAVTCPSY